MCAMVPIGAAVWSKKTAHLAALAAYLVLSTVSLGCRAVQSKNEGVDLVHLGQAPSLAALRGPFVIYDGRAG